MEAVVAVDGKRPSPATLFIHENTNYNGREAGAACVPMRVNDSITVQQLADEYCITSVVECDATGSVQPRAVALDSPLDVLHGGKYYIARRDVKHFAREPRVTFRGKVTVREFNATHGVIGREGETNANRGQAVAADPVGVAPSRKRPEREEDLFDSGTRTEIYAKEYEFVPFVGDLYNDGRNGMIHLKDVKKLCESVDLDEVEFRARHVQAEKILTHAKQLLLSYADGNGGRTSPEY
ncbi:uncharacterized protein TEOVI_000080500 [Trypanosoma equiperdum]|uniref:Uncharacterized protein n=4 Tax=Trypanozoon TaxID=39700 RepID=Q57W89_TRYB2|nr:hypothetical protein, conserved [Trypanosoma brucei gambiense DAL972]XP_847115.1 hypothetical protein, conserved [Trypanosoma brucei brucei TREU927]AAX70130.1 hypothetical protein, conserved [Trypanosoma brucei]RHW70800.1 hypothetical protein DPX39_080029000 [Trypanosoma brucei equiperdum]SCU69239.1 hypothetical protein, conserved [Trypanosoma equiperdum]AAZ13049.1 hypothetical protein, conserved [Trypanosoma brucei brucei TREU927]CBH13293.1 hypothetical protein, conserved [Trypanosoma bru|eukprot:XP_011775570.1 hypothetical protein, conserved [Trypanosoma brucei gambiense DAL972]